MSSVDKPSCSSRASYGVQFFTSVARADTSHARPTPDLSHITENLAEIPRLSLRKTNPIEVKEVLIKTKPNKATGCDLIPPRVLQQSDDVLCYPLNTLVNYVLDINAKIPQQWKLGEVAPVHKKNCGLDKSNYRPLTILCLEFSLQR